LASPEWATVPFAQAGASAADGLVNVMLSIPLLTEDSRMEGTGRPKIAATVDSASTSNNLLPRLMEDLKMSEQRKEQETHQG
jgi:hypothetical protein